MTWPIERMGRCAGAVCGVALMGGVLAAGTAAAKPSRRTPLQLLQATSAAVSHARSYEMDATIVQNGWRETLTLVVGGHGRASVRMERGTEHVAMVLEPGRAFLKASPTYWMREEKLANSVAWAASEHWFEVPVTSVRSFGGAERLFSKALFARCLTEDHGPLSRGGTTTVNGQPAVILKDAGGRPGSAPGRLVIATDGSAFPLQLIETGRTLPGGKIDACNDGKGDSGTGTLTMSHWNSAPDVHIPQQFIPIPAK